MGWFGRIFAGLFGGGRNVIAETAEVFRVNAEKHDTRQFDAQTAALAQFAAEFQQRTNLFDSLVDGLNRLPRPLFALSVWCFMLMAMVMPPEWFIARMSGLALVPLEMWGIITVVIGFFFGGRIQLSGQKLRTQIEQVRSAPSPEPTDRPASSLDILNS